MNEKKEKIIIDYEEPFINCRGRIQPIVEYESHQARVKLI